MKTLLMTMVLTGWTATADTPGRLVFDGRSYPLTHVYAREVVANGMAKIVVLAADRELAPATRVDEEALRELRFAGQLNAVEIELEPGGISWVIRTAKQGGSASGSQSPDPYHLKVEGGRVKGLVKMAKPETLGQTEFYYEFPVDALIEKRVAVPAPSLAEKAAAQQHPAAKVYLEFQTALQRADKVALQKRLDPAKASQLDTPEFAEIIKMIQSMQPKGIEVVRVTESGDEAQLEASGDAGERVGTVKMRKSRDQWVVVRESWRNR